MRLAAKDPLRSPRGEPKAGHVEPLLAPPFDDLATLSQTRLLAMRQAERDLFKALGAFARKGTHPVAELLAAAGGPFTTLIRYPDDGIGDAADQCAWYYHAHDPSDARPWGENGHFHCFAFTELLPPSATPLALPPTPNLEAGGLIHVVALCVNGTGVPDRLFALNRWASDEWLYPARDVIPLIDRFRIVKDRRFATTSAWLSALLRLLQPQIAWLLRERDEVLNAHREQDPEGFSEDPSLEVAATLPFDLDHHLAALDRALAMIRIE